MRHAIHLSLQLLGRNRPLPVILQRLRVAQIILDFAFDLRLRHHGVERWLGIGPFPAIAGPDPMTPINFFNRALISYAICKRQRSLKVPRRRFGLKEIEQCSCEDRTCRATKKENDCNTSSEKSRLRCVFRFQRKVTGAGLG